MLPLEKLSSLARRFREVEALLCTPQVLADPQQSRKLNEERAHLDKVVRVFETYQKVIQDLVESKEAFADPDLRELA